MRLSAKIAWSIGIAASLGFGFYRVRAWQKHAEDQRVKFETTAIDRGPIVAKVTASGTLSALVTVQVGSQVSGRLKEILADYNTPVKKGQVIARIDPQLLFAAQEQARANFIAAQADLQSAKVTALDASRQLARAKTLSDRKLTAQADFDTAEATANVAVAAVASAQARVQQMQASLHQAQINVEYTTIESPIDGVVISRSVELGQTVAASLQAPVLFVIAEDLRKMQVDTSVAEADVGKLESGMNATFSVDAYPTERFDGHVRQIRNSPTTLQNVVTYDAVIDVNNPRFQLRPGMTANVTFVHANRVDVLRVANAALRFKPAPELLEGGAAHGGSKRGAQAASLTSTTKRSKSDQPVDRRTLWVLRGHKPVAVPVKIGITDGTHTEVVEGALKEGDEAITDIAGTAATPQPSRPGGGMPRRIL
jgi:HlyD family secretion protein